MNKKVFEKSTVESANIFFCSLCGKEDEYFWCDECMTSIEDGDMIFCSRDKHLCMACFELLGVE